MKERKMWKKAFVLGWGLAAVLWLGGCGDRKPDCYRWADTAMGTVIRQSLYAESGEHAEELFREISGIVEKLEQETFSWRCEESELSALNRSAGEERGYLLSGRLTAVLERCRDVWENGGGALDVTLLPVVQLWNIDAWAAEETEKSYHLPEAEKLAERRALCGMERLRLEPEVLEADGETLQDRCFLLAGMQLDLGGVAKGEALGEIAEYLAREQVEGAVISLGGSVLTYGQKPDSTKWRVGIADPRNPSENLGVLYLEGQWFISTSGDYERYVEVDGMRYHHIIDPATGMPAASGVRGVTILARDGFLSDALSTACFILGTEKGMELAEKYQVQVLFVTDEGELVMSEGMKTYFRQQ